LPDVHRYVRGLEYRLERLADDVARDRRRMAEVVPLEERFARHLRRQGRTSAATPDAVEVGWQLEELRMSVFAQPLGVEGSVSPRRVARALDQLGAPR
jgi:ATP-dependent helicase HrpA